MGAVFGYCEVCGCQLAAAIKVCGECQTAARIADDYQTQLAEAQAEIERLRRVVLTWAEAAEANGYRSTAEAMRADAEAAR